MLHELLERGARLHPERLLVVDAHRATNWSQSLARSSGIAAGLSARKIDRFGIIGLDVGALVALLCGASAIGAEPCIYPSHSDPSTLAIRFRHTVVIGHTDSLDAIEAVDSSVVPSGRILSCTSPVLVLTTGTTGPPKGARHDWGRLLQAVRQRDDLVGSRWLLAYNPNQFAGLQVILHVLANGGTLVVGATNQPRSAYEAVRRHHVTHMSATPTFWNFFLGVLNDDDNLELRQITIGGEAVPPGLIQKLQQRFPRASISQIYASTEFGAASPVRDTLNGIPLKQFEERNANVNLRLVDGQVYVRSSVGMIGYFDEAELGDDWMPTGDLVEIRGDRVHFIGRTSEIINVGGEKVHPLPIEDRVNAVPGVAAAVVYGRPNPISGSIVAVDIVLLPGVKREIVENRIRAACADLPSAARPRRYRFVDDLPQQGGKIRRAAADA